MICAENAHRVELSRPAVHCTSVRVERFARCIYFYLPTILPHPMHFMRDYLPLTRKATASAYASAFRAATDLMRLLSIVGVGTIPTPCVYRITITTRPADAFRAWCRPSSGLQ